MKNKVEPYSDGENILDKITYFNNTGEVDRVRYHLNGRLHRADGPSDTYYYHNGGISAEYYEIDGLMHREDGPAVIRYNEDGSIKGEFFFVNDVKYSNLVLDCPINRELYKGKFIEHGGNLWIKDQNVRND